MPFSRSETFHNAHRSLVVPILLYPLEVRHTEIAHRLQATQKAKLEACAALAETDDTETLVSLAFLVYLFYITLNTDLEIEVGHWYNLSITMDLAIPGSIRDHDASLPPEHLLIYSEPWPNIRVPQSRPDPCPTLPA